MSMKDPSVCLYFHSTTTDLQGRGDEQRASTVVDEGSCNKSCIILVSSGSLAVVIMCLALMLYYAVCKDKDKGMKKSLNIIEKSISDSS